MLFNSLSFIAFFVIVTPLYFILPHRFRWILLLLASCYFYMAFVPVYILILGFTIVIDYFAGLKIESSQGHTRRFYLICSIIANVGILCVFKYYNFINGNISWLFNHYGGTNPLPYLSILLPIGLSFHTFQAMSYTIEVYRGNQKAERHFGIYALYVMFYPQLVAGPIERPQNIIHQFYVEQRFDYKRVTGGLKLMLWGFFLKVVIADNFALVANNVFDGYQHFGAVGTIIGVLSFTIQIFCDFAGYSSIAIGAAAVMGFELMTNFRRPYLATTLSDFWTRWHISLSTWFRDYLYIPLGGNRVKLPRWCLNILIVFTISGLWHGASWTFVIWGALHGSILIIERLLKPTGNRLARLTGLAGLPLLHNLLRGMVTFIIVSIAWVFFRATNLQQAFSMLKHLFAHSDLNDARGALAPWGRESLSKVLMLGFTGLLLFVHLYQEFAGSISALIARQVLVVRWGVYLLLIFSIILFGVFQSSRFIYFQF
ncbi:MBOAT family O-acyltransferase [Mucilaginibacter celer]|uniref:MBOAT family protein n=1 Tax=Mucilaginibacter celer TaxID=2305508 RepID=A0A494VPU0_9SPHI|nr:MBOAT family O-acyltransferase [Mucilaginibacter celer]AYL97516.1 MBOAT family protein [Mucilaginibacter celer]